MLFRSWQLVAKAPRDPRSHITDASTIVAVAIAPLDSKIVYAGIRTGGIMKSSNGGDTWAASNTGLTDKRIGSLAVDPRDPQIVYASAWDGGVFRSTDGARSWRRFDRGLPRYPVLALAIDPAGRTIFAGTGGGGVVDLRLAR